MQGPGSFYFLTEPRLNLKDLFYGEVFFFTHMLHGIGIFVYILAIFFLVFIYCKYSNPMDAKFVIWKHRGLQHKHHALTFRVKQPRYNSETCGFPRGKTPPHGNLEISDWGYGTSRLDSLSGTVGQRRISIPIGSMYGYVWYIYLHLVDLLW